MLWRRVLCVASWNRGGEDFAVSVSKCFLSSVDDAHVCVLPCCVSFFTHTVTGSHALTHHTFALTVPVANEKHNNNRGFHAAAVAEPCPMRALEIAEQLRLQSRGPERFAPAFAARAATRAIESFQNTFKTWGEARVGTWRRYAHRVGTTVLSRIHPDDETLSNLPAACSSVEVIYPDTSSVDETRHELTKLLTDRALAVKKRFQINAFIGVPITFPMMFTPLSNLPMYWFAWRAYEQRNGFKRAAQALRTTQRFECAEAREGCDKETIKEESSSGSQGTDDRETVSKPQSSAEVIAQWVDVDKKCERTGVDANEVAVSPSGFVCCRVVPNPAIPPPTLLFVPCALLREENVWDLLSDQKSEEDGTEKVSLVERATRIQHLTSLAKRYKRALKV